MRGFGVRDDARGRALAQVEDAFARGRIGEADRDLRLMRVRDAQTPDELTALTRDLALPTHDADPWAAGPAPARPSPVPTRPRTSSTTKTAATPVAVLLAGVAVVAAGIAALVLFAGPGPTSIDGPVSGEAQVAPDESVVTADGGLDAGRLRAVLRAYPERFGTSEAVQLALADGRVSVTVPLGGAEPVAQMWEWTGEWERLTGRTPLSSDVATVDLRTLDVRRLVRNVEAARTSLGPQARVLRVVVSDAGSGARVRVELVGEDAAGTLVTTTDGTVLRGVRS